MMNRTGRVQVTSPECALAAEMFDHFRLAGTMKQILAIHREMCNTLNLKPTRIPDFYPKLKAKLASSWKAQALFKKFDARANNKVYNKGKACPQTKVLIIGAGPCGMRAAIECQLLGAKVVVIEKRDRLSRNNVLHLWPFVIHDLRALGAKKFFGKFCAGSIDHISIRQLQCILMKVALLLGVEFHEGVSFEDLLEPTITDNNEKLGWRAQVTPHDHPVAQYEFDVLMGADGKRNTLNGFKRKEFRGKLAIAITANFINRHSEQEASVQEISGVAFIFNQKFFKDLYEETGIDLENIVYYKDDTHYFVMTAKKHSLIEKGVILKDYAETAKLLSPDNIDRNALMAYAREAAHFSTDGLLPDMQFALNHYGKPDVALFDFTSMFAAENATKVVEVRGQRLMVCLVGDSLLEPFWPTGSGCARGFLSALDACWAVRSWGAAPANHPLAVIAERESIYRLLAQTTPENLNRDFSSYTLEPSSRYPNLNRTAVAPHQVTAFYDTDDPNAKSQAAIKAIQSHQTNIGSTSVSSKKRKRESHVHADALLHWLRKQVAPFPHITVDNLSHSMRSGQVLCAVIHRYRPDLIDIDSLQPDDVQGNNQLAFDVLERELGINPVMTGIQMAESEVPDEVKMMAYLSNIYDTFKGEIPHVKHPHYDLPDMEKKYHSRTPIDHSLANYSGKIAAAAEKRNESLKKNRKRRNYHSGRYNAPSTEERVKKLQEFANRSSEKHSKRHDHRNVSKEQFCKSVRMLHFNARREFNTDPFDDYSLYVYRQQAPQFDDRVKELEKKLTQRERDRSTAPMKGLGPMEDSIHSKIKSVDELLRGGASMSDKKPKDLLRAIGKIESSDWNVKEIEKKIKENHLGKSPAHGREKVPKWNREQFLARQTKLERHGVERQESCEGKFREIDTNMKRLDRKIKEGNVLEVGTRGKNKVANLLDQFVKKTEAECEKPAPVEQGHQLMKTNSKVALNLNNKNQLCRACTKPVYVVERLTAEGFTFHKACFKCHFCSTTLRVGTYSYDRNGQYGNNFFCTQHFGLMGKSGKSVRDQYEDGVRHQVTDIAGPDLLDRGETPERIGLVVGIPTDSGRAGVGAEEEDGAEMDEDEWTDRNFGASELSSNGILSGGGDDSSSDEEFSQALEKLGSDGEKENSENESEMDSDSENEYDSDESDSFSYDEYSTGDETSEASGSDGGVPSYGTERSVERAARELRRQEVPPAPQRTPTTTDTEVGSEEETSKTSEVANSATEVSTDSEFAHDDPTPTRELPYITINDENVTKTRGSNFHRSKQANVKKDFGAQEKSANNKKTQNAPFGAVKVRVTGGNDKNVTVVKPAIEILERPLSKPVITAPVRPSEFLLCRTQSTSGIATKRALELKKKYLLGNPSTLSIQKSDSASRLDSKFKSFQSNISECQKLLNAPAESSPCMRAFLASASERNYPKSPTLSTPVGLDFNKTESADDINCNKKDIPMPDIIRNLCERSETNNVYDKIVDDLQICDDKKDSLDLTKRNDEDNNSVPDETRANDDIVNIPTAETHIIVPKVPWNKTDEIEQHSRTATDIESDSLSELDTSSGAVEKKLSGASSTVSLPVPRVQIHDTSGELMQMDSLMIVDGKYVGPIDSDDDCNDKLVNDPPPTQEVKEIKRVDDQTEEVTKPPTNSSNNSSESTNDVTTLAHTETELSDWAYDGAMGEMEHYDDTEFKLGVANKNLHRLKKPKNIHKSKLLDDAANTENQQHVCGKNSTPVEVRSPYMKAVEEFDFMDMGSQDSLIDAFATTDNALMKNRGFMEIIDIEDDKVSTVHNINNRDLNSPVNDRSMNFIEQSACVINNTDVLSTKIGVEGFISSPIDKYDTKGSNTDVHQEKVIEDLSVELKSDNFHGQSSNDNNSDYVVEMESVLSLTTTTDTNAPTSVLEDINIKVDEKEQNKCKDNIAVGNGKDQTNLSENKTEDVAIDSITNDVMTSIHNKLNSKLSCQVSHSNMIITVEPLSNEGINFVKPNLIRAKSFVQMEADACTSRKVQEIMKAKDKQKDLVRDLVLDRLSASRPERRSTKRVRNSPEVNKYNAKDFIIERIVLERQGPPIADLKLHPQVVGNKNIVPGKGNLKVSLNRSNSSQNKSTLPMIVKTNNASPLRSPRKSMEIPFETTFTALKDDSGLPSSQSKKPFASRSTEISSMSSGIVRSCTASDVAKTSLSDSHLFSPLPAEHQNSTESSMVSGELKRLTLNEAIAFKNVSAIKQEKQGTKENKRSQMKMTSMSDPNLSDFVRTERKGKTKDKERRKSIIQTVSNFFNKRLSPKSKETSKLVSCSDYDTPKKSHSEWSVRAVAEAVNLEPESPPPVPPLPLNYELPSTTSSATVLSNRRSSLSDSSVQLAASEARTRLLEREVAELEDELRKSEHGDQSVVGLARGAGGDAETLGRWFDARRRLAAARHEWRTRAGREADLRLAERHARLLRRLRRSDLSAAEESAVVGEMMQISAQRESLTAMREQDKTRIQQFDEGTLDPQILAALTKRKN